MALVADNLLTAVRTAIYQDSTKITDDVILMYLNEAIDTIGSKDSDRCAVLYDAVLSCLQYLSTKYRIDLAESSGGSTYRMEKVGQVQIQVENTQDDFYASDPYLPLYNKYLSGEYGIGSGCPIMARADNKILVGGVNLTEVERVKRSPDSVNGLKGVTSVDRGGIWDYRRNRGGLR